MYSVVSFYFLNPAQPLLLTVMALGGAALAWIEGHRRLVATALAILGLYLVIHVLVQRSAVDQGDFVRYNLNPAPVFIVLAAMGSGHLLNDDLRWTRIVGWIVCGLLAFQTGRSWLQLPRVYSPEFTAEYEYLRDAARRLPPGTTLVAENPWSVRSSTGLPTVLPQQAEPAARSGGGPVVYVNTVSGRSAWMDRLDATVGSTCLDRTIIGGREVGFWRLGPPVHLPENEVSR